MLFITCSVCQQKVFRAAMAKHLSECHPKAASTPTVPDDRPTTYHHPVCNRTTEMTAEQFTAHLVNDLPVAYCRGCKCDVAIDELYWVENAENLAEYFAAQRPGERVG